jgi:D-alanine-D-alanine ligase
MEDRSMSAAASRPRWRIVVLAGGQSAERTISLRSGAAVVSALVAAGHRATAIDPAEGAISNIDWLRFDAAFIALHGGEGEDGRVQQELESRGVPYTGSCPMACRLAMSKSASKDRFIEFGIPTPPFVPFAASDRAATVADRVARLGYPLVIKPDAQGSSLGVTVTDSRAELDHAISAAAEYDNALLAEAFIRGREFTVAVLNDRPLPVLEIVTPQRVFSYDAKYASPLTEYRFEFELPNPQRAALTRAAVAATQALGTSGLARVDLMLGQDGRPCVLEVNTSPGMSPRSLAPQAAARAGLDMPQLCDQLVQECLAATRVA